jgi:hypothetical protein
MMMISTPIRTGRNGYVVLTLILVAIVAVSLLIPGAPETVFAGRYGGNGYARYIAKCKGKCGKKNGAIASCVKRDRRTHVNNCRQIYKADHALCTDGPCAKDVKTRLKTCIHDAGAQARYDSKTINRKGFGVKKCGACCQRSKGQGSCLTYFSPSRFYGSFRYHGLHCDDQNGSGGAPCTAQCEAVAKGATARCGKAKPGDPTCLQQVEQALQACLASCQPQPPGSSRGAFLGDLSGRLRAHAALWLPWLVQGWNG